MDAGNLKRKKRRKKKKRNKKEKQKDRLKALKNREKKIKKTTLAMILGILGGGGQAMAVKIIGHRGFAGLWPENTLIGFEKALDLGVDGIEMDVHLTQDRYVIVHHDFELNPSIARKNGKWVEKPLPIKEMTYAELLTYEVGQLKKDTPYGRLYPEQKDVPGQRMPTLHQVIELTLKKSPKTELWIELKTDPSHPHSQDAATLMGAVLEVLKAYPLVRYRLISFDWTGFSMAQGHRLGYLTEHSALDQLEKIGDFWNIPFSEWTEDLHKAVRHHRKEIGVWTVNDPLVMQRLIAGGVDAITTDRPDKLKELLKKESPKGS